MHRSKVEELGHTHTTEEWLMGHRRPARVGREVKISAKVSVTQNVYKAPGGLIRATVEFADGQITALELSGDFFLYPKESVARLEEELVGESIDNILAVIRAAYDSYSIESPGVTPEDIVRAITGKPLRA